MTAAARWIAGLFMIMAALLTIRAEFPRIIHEP